MGETSNRNQLVVKSYKYQSSHPIENIITDPTSRDTDWVNVMQDELNQFERSQVWHLVPRPKDRSKLYRGMIGSLLYLTASRPKIVFSIGLCARFQENPKESHLTAIKRILRYLKGTTDLCLSYPKGSNFNLVGYDDADYAGFLVDRKSASSMAHFLGSCLVSWATKK
ncbi:secreted RxLR effector protein 161-like [Nicotiana sylvestris]|uniref:secreted RxLR effector protein 161-like n=1 Tax=Nicotiana sylvestris TaxID=4096 RepID=UPI00388CE81E